MRSCALRSGPCGPVSLWEESPWTVGPSQVEEAAMTPHGFSFASSSHPDRKPLKVFMVLEQMDPCPAGFTRLFSCPVTLWTVPPRHLAIALCWDNVGKETL